MAHSEKQNEEPQKPNEKPNEDIRPPDYERFEESVDPLKLKGRMVNKNIKKR